MTGFNPQLEPSTAAVLVSAEEPGVAAVFADPQRRNGPE